ncbi:MAG: chemotaxis response regulator protein-glutamate methylesterase [Burkholderiales bacterium]|nr:chemotaxis response regulator protein-glutamate methylesterase [Burkholderiales bacterium]
MNRIRVLVVDDSALIRKVLTEIIGAQHDMEVVGTAPNPVHALEKIEALRPHVLTLDVEMPVMNGLDFLESLMRTRPMPVLMVSSLTERGGELTLRALELGAVDFVTKPRLGIENGMRDYAADICARLRAAAAARVGVRSSVPRPAPRLGGPAFVSSEKLIVVGASTGGTEAIRELLAGMPPDSPGILIVQHMPAQFTPSFAARLDRSCALTVREAAGGERILPGHAFVAPGHSHLLLRRDGSNYVTALSDAEPVNRHRPSVDVLFHSAAQLAGANAAGVILTGMGRDGAAGMAAMHQAGARTYAQNEDTCVVYGMPREAVAAGGVDQVLPLHEIAPRLLQHIRSGQRLRI